MKNIALSLSILGLILSGCSSEEKTQTAKGAQMQMPPLPVKAYEVKLQERAFSKSYAAILKPFEEVAVVARVSGVLLAQKFVEGSYVKKGSILYEIEKDEYKAALDLATATYKKAQASYTKVKKDFARGEYLFNNKAISQQQYDELTYQRDSAKAELQATKASHAKALLEYNYTTIKAPISGQIGISQSDVGSLITAANTHLATITALEPLYAEFSLPNSDVLKYRSQITLGARVSMEQGGAVHEGIIDFIAPSLDAKTDTLLVRSKFQNSSKTLVIGSYAQIKVDGFVYKNIAIVPESALIKTPEAVVVYVIGEEGVLSMRPVEIAQVSNGEAIVTSGLEAAEKIVVSNIAKIRPNIKVSIMGGD